MASMDQIKDLRERTGAGILDCKKALAENGDSVEKAIDWLRAKGLSSAAKKSGRIASEGLVEAYIHAGGKIGVLVELNCETDFVALNEKFKALARDIAMHIAAAAPEYLSREEVPADAYEKEKAVQLEKTMAEGKPAAIAQKIVDGRMSKWYEEVCLLDQKFIKDDSKTVDAYVKEAGGHRPPRVADRPAAARHRAVARAPAGVAGVADPHDELGAVGVPGGPTPEHVGEELGGARVVEPEVAEGGLERAHAPLDVGDAEVAGVHVDLREAEPEERAVGGLAAREPAALDAEPEVAPRLRARAGPDERLLHVEEAPRALVQEPPALGRRAEAPGPADEIGPRREAEVPVQLGGRGGRAEEEGEHRAAGHPAAVGYATIRTGT